MAGRQTHLVDGDVVSRLITSASQQIRQTLVLSDKPKGAIATTICFETLIALADEQINNVDFHAVSPRWLSLYVDTNILSAIYDICTGASGPIAVRKLDMAIIVGGATKPKRMEWIQRAIKLAQTGFQQGRTSDPLARGPDNPRKRRRTDTESGILFAYNTIPSLSSPPSLESYLTHHVAKPFVLRGYLVDGKATAPWPAVERWRDPDYLLSKVGRGRCVPVEEGRSYDDVDWGQKIVRFEDFLVRAGFHNAERDTPTDRPMYLAQHSLFRQFPELESDISLPDFVWSEPPAPAGLPLYRRPETENGVIINVWVGSGSGEIVSPAHTVSHNTLIDWC